MATSAEIAATIRENIASSPGVTEISVDGLHIKLDKNALDYWERRAAREATPSTRPISASIDLSGG